MKIGYACVSKLNGEQNLDLKIDALKNHGVQAKDIYCDVQLEASCAKPQFELCLKALRKGDILVLYSLDSIGRSLLDVLKIINEIQDNKIALRIVDDLGAGVDTSTAMGKMMHQLESMFS